MTIQQSDSWLCFETCSKDSNFEGSGVVVAMLAKRRGVIQKGEKTKGKIEGLIMHSFKRIKLFFF